MKTAFKIAWYIILAVVTALRMIVAFPLVAVWIGADVCGDKAMTDKLDRWIDRIVGGARS